MENKQTQVWHIVGTQIGRNSFLAAILVSVFVLTAIFARNRGSGACQILNSEYAGQQSMFSATQVQRKGSENRSKNSQLLLKYFESVSVPESRLIYEVSCRFLTKKVITASMPSDFVRGSKRSFGVLVTVY